MGKQRIFHLRGGSSYPMRGDRGGMGSSRNFSDNPLPWYLVNGWRVVSMTCSHVTDEHGTQVVSGYVVIEQTQDRPTDTESDEPDQALAAGRSDSA
jgi:hypothetical protein